MADFTLEEMRHQAYEQLLLHAEPDCTPSIVGEEAAILDRHMRCGVWAASTHYGNGDQVQVFPRNGHRYLCILTGTSSATAPSWSTSEGCTVSDGTTSWYECGKDYENVFDVRAAAHEAWSVKAARASHLVTTSAGNSRVEASLLHEQCRARAREFTPLV
jgi:hypothetical protein